MATIAEKDLTVDVPAYSSYLDVRRPEWKGRAAEIVGLYSILQFLGADRVPDSIDDLIAKGYHIVAYQESVGWRPQGIVRLACECGVDAEICGSAEKADKKMATEFWHEIAKAPCLVSIHEEFNPSRRKTWIVTTHRDSNYLHYINLDARDRMQPRRKVTIPGFLSGWNCHFITFKR